MINLGAIFIGNTIGAVLMIILLISSRTHARTVFVDEKIFLTMVWLTLSLCTAEFLSFLVDGATFPGAMMLNRILNSLLFAANISFAFIWTVYVDFKVYGDQQRLRRRYVWIGLPAAAIVLMSLLNLFSDVFFTISAENVYSRTSLVPLTYLCSYGYLLYGMTLVYGRKNQGRKYLFLPVMVFMIPIMIGSLCQFFFYGLSLVWVSVAVAVVSLYINIQNEDAYVDALTGLYNRLYLNRHLREIRPGKGQCLAGIMLDIDHFKSINDTYGHAMGDQALQDVGRLLYRVADTHQAIAVRFAGDEFILLRSVSDRSEVEEMGHALRKAAEEFNNRKQRPYTLAFSMGIALFQEGAESLDDFISSMDTAMYQDKHQREGRMEAP